MLVNMLERKERFERVGLRGSGLGLGLPEPCACCLCSVLFARAPVLGICFFVSVIYKSVESVSSAGYTPTLGRRGVCACDV